MELQKRARGKGEPGVCGSGPMVSGWLTALPALFIGVPSGK